MNLMHASDEDQIVTVQMTSNVRVKTWCLLSTGDAPRHRPSRGPKIAPGPLNKGDHAGCVAQHYKRFFMLSGIHQCLVAV